VAASRAHGGHGLQNRACAERGQGRHSATSCPPPMHLAHSPHRPTRLDGPRQEQARQRPEVGQASPLQLAHQVERRGWCAGGSSANGLRVIGCLQDFCLARARDAGRTLKVCRLLVDDHDDMAAKAMSWALRELIVHDPAAVRGFLERYADQPAARVKREVRNKLETGLRNPTSGVSRTRRSKAGRNSRGRSSPGAKLIASRGEPPGQVQTHLSGITDGAIATESWTAPGLPACSPAPARRGEAPLGLERNRLRRGGRTAPDAPAWRRDAGFSSPRSCSPITDKRRKGG